MNDLRKEFDELSKDFKDNYKLTKPSDLIILTDNILKVNLDIYIKQLVKFTDFYNEFDIKIISDIEVVSYRAYRDRALTYMMICQNQYIIPITNEVTKRSNEKLQVKAEESIKLGNTLIKEAKKSSNFAITTFFIAFILSIVSLILGYWSGKESEKILNRNNETINNISIELKSIKENNDSHFKILNKQNQSVMLKIDSVLINKKSN